MSTAARETHSLPPGERVFFGVIRRHGRESPRLFTDIPPRDLTGRKDSPLVYCTRIDGTWWVRQPLPSLMATYERLKGLGKLPPQDRGIAPKEKPKQGVDRTRWTPPAVTWDRDAPSTVPWR